MLRFFGFSFNYKIYRYIHVIYLQQILLMLLSHLAMLWVCYFWRLLSFLISSLNFLHFMLSWYADPCGLYCRVGNLLYVKGPVKDGTRVSNEGLDVCIKGNPEVRSHCNHVTTWGTETSGMFSRCPYFLRGLWKIRLYNRERVSWHENAPFRAS